MEVRSLFLFPENIVYKSVFSEQTRTVRAIYIHPGFDQEAVVSDNDIGLMELDSPLVYTESVRTIALALPNHIPMPTARVSGWGSISNNDTVIMPDHLQTIVLPVLTNEECQTIIAWSNSTVHPHEICTGNGDAGGIGTCGGDSGSGLVQGVSED